MDAHLFTYGSLMFAPVWQRVVRTVYPSSPATVRGHERCAIRGQSYPGMVAKEGACVEGVLYFDVSQEDIAALDAFEGEEYQRVRIDAVLPSGDTVRAEAYLYVRPENLSGLPWHPGKFEMARFISDHFGLPGKQDRRV